MYNNLSFLFNKTSCVDSYDDKAATEKILQKLKLENFQVCILGTVFAAVVNKQRRDIKA